MGSLRGLWIKRYDDVKTQRYVELYNEIYEDFKPKNYVCEIVSTPKEAKKLVEEGFEYVSEINGVQLYHKIDEKV